MIREIIRKGRGKGVRVRVGKRKLVVRKVEGILGCKSKEGLPVCHRIN